MSITHLYKVAEFLKKKLPIINGERYCTPCLIVYKFISDITDRKSFLQINLECGVQYFIDRKKIVFFPIKRF